jgi:hypothetical protein
MAWVLLSSTEKAHGATRNHVRPCQISMGGGHHSDNDIRRRMNATGARGFGWEVKLNGKPRAWHGRDGSVYVVGDFIYSNGGFVRVKAHCWGGDYGPDHFVG